MLVRLFTFSTLLFSTTLLANTHDEQEWGIAAMVRSATTPYNIFEGSNQEVDPAVTTFIPMMFFQGETFFIDGMEGGVHLYTEEDWQLNALLRLRYIDLPKQYQNQVGGDTGDMGIQAKYTINDDWALEADIMSDSKGRLHSIARAAGDFDFGDWNLQPLFELRWKEAEFNSHYYSVTQATGENIGAGVDLKMGLMSRYHVTSNLYLLGGNYVTRLDDNAYDSAVIDEQWQAELFLGFGFFNDKSKSTRSDLSNSPYVRVAHGWATPSNIGDIFTGNAEKDEYNHQLSSLFYGHPLTDELFGLPLDIYLTPGLAWHYGTDHQSSTAEYVVAIKAFANFTWPTQWRFGVAEGLSYINDITYIEETEMISKDRRPSHLLNYLDFSLDVNVGDLFNHRPLDNVWFGYSLHHRSAIFEKASQYGRIKGGSNYNTLYLQFDL
ncbi:MipA/OmpV family protein [Aliivibrio kagoshimensis]|uniref:MipA/OmpV family protein n=1 Tax=Aliivibrio kagoshimensis TaxID=2910230 RepID=UPI003D0EE16B